MNECITYTFPVVHKALCRKCSVGTRYGTRLKMLSTHFYTTRQLRALQIYSGTGTYTIEQKSRCKLSWDQCWDPDPGPDQHQSEMQDPDPHTSKSKFKSCRGSKWTYWEPWTLAMEAWRLKNMRDRRVCRQVVALIRIRIRMKVKSRIRSQWKEGPGSASRIRNTALDCYQILLRYLS